MGFSGHLANQSQTPFQALSCLSDSKRIPKPRLIMKCPNLLIPNVPHARRTLARVGRVLPLLLPWTSGAAVLSNVSEIKTGFLSDSLFSSRSELRWTQSWESVGSEGVIATQNDIARTGWLPMSQWADTQSFAYPESAGIAESSPIVGLSSWVESLLDPVSGWTSASVLGDGPSSITLEWGTSSSITLLPGVADQAIPIFLRNPGATVEVGGLDLKFRIEGSGGSLPAFSSVDLRASTFVSPGAPFRVSNSVQGADANNTPQLQFWSVSINDPFSPPTLPGGTVTQVGVVRLSTVGVLSGTWGLSFQSEATALTGPLGDTIDIGFRNANLQVVPEPEEFALIAASTLRGLAALLRARHPRNG